MKLTKSISYNAFFSQSFDEKVNKKKKNPYLVTFFLIGMAMIGAISVHASINNVNMHRDKESGISFTFHDIFNNQVESVFVYVTDPRNPISTTTSIDYTIGNNKKHKELSGYLVNSYVLDEYFRNSLFVVREEGQYIITSILRFDSIAHDLVLVPFVEHDGNVETDVCCEYITFLPGRSDNYDLVVYNHSKFSPTFSKKVYRNNYDKGFVEQLQ